MELIYRTKTVSIDVGSGAAVCKAIYDFVNPYTNKVSYVSGETQIKFNDRFYLSIPSGIANRGHIYLIREDETSVDLGNVFGYWATDNHAQMLLKIAGPILILKIVRENNPENHGTICWIANGNNDFVNAVPYGTVMSIDVGTYHDARTVEPTLYSLKTLIPFGVTPQKIAYISYSYISNSDNILIQLNDIYSCSTITRDSLITISGQNYYAIGANFLIQVDAN